MVILGLPPSTSLFCRCRILNPFFCCFFSLQRTKARLKVTEKELKDLQWEHEVLEQRFVKVSRRQAGPAGSLEWEPEREPEPEWETEPEPEREWEWEPEPGGTSLVTRLCSQSGWSPGAHRSFCEA